MYFNSIKVRLELKKACELMRIFFNFNSIKVRLEPKLTFRDRLPKHISIP